MAKELIYNDHLLTKLYNGVEKLAKTVGVTMGPRGRNVLLQKVLSNPVITKDGVSVAKEITLLDPIENMGAQILKEAALNTNRDVGDGTTTATVLAFAIFKEGRRNVTAGANPVELKRGMDIATEHLVKVIKRLSKKVSTNSEIEQVATISANGDKTIGKMIAKAMDKIGKDGVITIEEANSITDELVILDGMKIKTGYLSQSFINTPKMTVELINPYILMVGKNLNSVNEIMVILQGVIKEKRSLVVIANDIEGEVLSTLVLNKVKGALDVVAIKSPEYGDRRKDTLVDISVLTNGTVLGSDNLVPLSSGTLSHLGKAEKVIVTADSTTIINGGGSKEAINNRITTIKTLLSTEESTYTADKFRERIAKLSGGIAIIKVGAPTETEMKERRDRLDDALGATKSAIEEGIIIGGGCALIKTLKYPMEELSGDMKIGADIINKAIEAPVRQIAYNAGYDGGVVMNQVKELFLNEGFDASTGQYVDMFKAGIIDPTKVLRVSLQNAVSVASILLTSQCGIFDIPSVNKDVSPVNANMLLGNQR